MGCGFLRLGNIRLDSIPRRPSSHTFCLARAARAGTRSRDCLHRFRKSFRFCFGLVNLIKRSDEGVDAPVDIAVE